MFLTGCMKQVILTTDTTLDVNVRKAGDDLFLYDSWKVSFRLNLNIMLPSSRVGGSVFVVIGAAVVGVIVDSVVPDALNVVCPADEEPISACVVRSSVTFLTVVKTSEVWSTVTGFIDINIVVLFCIGVGSIVTWDVSGTDVAALAEVADSAWPVVVTVSTAIECNPVDETSARVVLVVSGSFLTVSAVVVSSVAADVAPVKVEAEAVKIALEAGIFVVGGAVSDADTVVSLGVIEYVLAGNGSVVTSDCVVDFIANCTVFVTASVVATACVGWSVAMTSIGKSNEHQVRVQ